MREAVKWNEEHDDERVRKKNTHEVSLEKKRGLIGLTSSIKAVNGPSGSEPFLDEWGPVLGSLPAARSFKMDVMLSGVKSSC